MDANKKYATGYWNVSPKLNIRIQVDELIEVLSGDNLIEIELSCPLRDEDITRAIVRFVQSRDSEIMIIASPLSCCSY